MVQISLVISYKARGQVPQYVDLITQDKPTPTTP